MATPRRTAIMLTPSHARWLSLGVVCAIGGSFPLEVWLDDMARTTGLVAGALRVLGLVGAIILFLDIHGQVANAPDGQLDERQRQERERAYVASYKIMLGGLSIGWFYVVQARGWGWWLADPRMTTDIVAALIILAMALPGVILAWTNLDDGDA